MGSAVADQFGPDRVRDGTNGAALDVMSGRLPWVNAGHPSPLLLHAGHIVARLDSPTTLPGGSGGATPVVTKTTLLFNAVGSRASVPAP